MSQSKETKDENRSSDDSSARISGRMTRREWLAELGAAALIVGLPAELDGADSGKETGAGSLPQGLYVPSSEHLGHALTSDDLFHVIPPGSETDYVRPASAAFEPAFFSQEQFQTVRRVVELLLGFPPKESSQQSQAGGDREDPAENIAQWIDLDMASAAPVRAAAQALSPEHRTVALHYYGPETIQHVETEEPDRTCREGLVWLDQRSQQDHGAEFLKLPEPQQIEILESLSPAHRSQRATQVGSRFFELIKREMIRGYYTSRQGLKELDYKGNSFYPQSPGCPKNGHP
jgi:hypothetical protein